MHVTAVRRAVQPQLEQPRVISLFVRDISEGGLCGVTTEAIGSTEELVLFIPPRGGRGGRDVRCQVARCEELESRFCVGLMFRDPLTEAANHLH